MAMNHEELLKKVDSVFYEDEGGTQLDLAGFNNQYRALRAVVELHKPDVLNPEQCEVCTLHTDYSHRYIVYPCETIQSIGKELSNGD